MLDPMLDHAAGKDSGHTPKIHSGYPVNFRHKVASNRNFGASRVLDG